MSEDFSAWVGRREEVVDVLEPARTNALRIAALGQMTPLAAGDDLPLLHHWLYFWDVRPPEGLGPDGHPARGGFLPPVPLPRRMWAGGRLKFLAPLKVGERVTKASTILKVEAKSGKSGELVFVTVEHQLSGAAGVAIVEEQDIVYRGAAAAGSIKGPTGEAPAPTALWRREIAADPVLLFRYSALTFNGHRIHYDRDYVTKVEGYPGLIFHGPMQAALLVEFAAHLHGGTAPKKFSYRGLQPLFEGGEFSVNANEIAEGLDIWVANAEGAPTMRGTASW